MKEASRTKKVTPGDGSEPGRKFTILPGVGLVDLDDPKLTRQLAERRPARWATTSRAATVRRTSASSSCVAFLHFVVLSECECWRATSPAALRRRAQAEC